MINYLKNIEYAANKVFEAINHETDELMNLIEEREAALKEPKFFEQLGWDYDLHEDYDEIRVMNFFHRAAEARKKLSPKLSEIDSKIENITTAIDYHDSSVRILCSSILQFAKQGLSIAHGSLPTCPDGRLVGSQNLKNVIWQARNHGIHYEDSPSHNQKVVECFEQLENDFGTHLSLYAHPSTNLSKEVIQVLKWHGFVSFSEDMMTLTYI